LEPAFGGVLRSKSKHLRQDTFVASICFCRFSDGLVAGFICLGGEFLGQIDLGKYV
jgi:hypothetical protein